MVTRRSVRGAPARASILRAQLVIRALGGAIGLVVIACSSPSGSGPATTTPPDASAEGSPVVISTTHRTARPQNWSVDYWMWLPSGGDPIDGTQAAVQSLKPALMRVGGYNSDANTPDPFDDVQLDKAIAYARSIGAEPLLQVPLIADVDGRLPTAATAAAMVTYANITQKCGVKYFAIGNEPDLYDSQGGLTDMTQPAFPGYTPQDYCASVNAFSAAMKAVDPTIQIIGPQLSYRYQAGNDWLTPILAGCGDAFDIVSVQRFPFESAQATVSRASGDASSLRRTVASLREIMSAAGHGNKPLAITGMNVAGGVLPSPPIPDAAQGTVGSALWTADIVGTAQELNLWTTVAWAICDTDDASFGMIGMPPAHTPRPEYYAYSLYADHFGPTLVDVTQAPSGVSAHATRNQADNGTDVVVVNWNNAPAPLAFEVTGLPSAPPAPVYQLPALSMAAVEIPDKGTASAWVYGGPQFAAATGPVPLAQGSTVAPEDGGQRDGGSATDATSLQCAAQSLPSAAITTMGQTSAIGVAFGAGTEKWGSFSYAGSGEPMPTMTVTPDGNGFVFSAQITASPMNGYEGVGLFFNSQYCANVSAYTGIRFDVSGNLGACKLSFGASSAGDVSTADDPSRGECSLGSAGCYGGSSDITAQLGGLMAEDAHAPDAMTPDAMNPDAADGVVPDDAMAADATTDAANEDAMSLDAISPGDAMTDSAVVDAGTPQVVTVTVPFTAESGGMPVATVDPSALVSIQWQFMAPSGSCTASLTISNVSFY